jgi:hypothetical protein
VIVSLAAVHDLRSSTRAIARMSHSIVKQQFASPRFPGNAKYSQATGRCKGFSTASIHPHHRRATSHFRPSPQHSTPRPLSR